MFGKWCFAVSVMEAEEVCVSNGKISPNFEFIFKIISQGEKSEIEVI